MRTEFTLLMDKINGKIQYFLCFSYLKLRHIEKSSEVPVAKSNSGCLTLIAVLIYFSPTFVPKSLQLYTLKQECDTTRHRCVCGKCKGAATVQTQRGLKSTGSVEAKASSR